MPDLIGRADRGGRAGPPAVRTALLSPSVLTLPGSPRREGTRFTAGADTDTFTSLALPSQHLRRGSIWRWPC